MRALQRLAAATVIFAGAMIIASVFWMAGGDSYEVTISRGFRQVLLMAGSTLAIVGGVIGVVASRRPAFSSGTAHPARTNA